MNNLETHVLRLIAENVDSPDVFMDDSEGMAPIRDSINDAVEELCMVTGHYRRKYLLACMESRGLYRLSPQNDEMGWIIDIWDRNRKKQLTQTHMKNLAASDFKFLSQDGDPDYWWHMGYNFLGLFPRPASKGRILEMEMIAVPKRYVHNQTPIRLREQWNQAAIFRACSEFYASRGDAGRATEYFSRYLETAGIMNLHPEQAERFHQFYGGRKDKDAT